MCGGKTAAPNASNRVVAAPPSGRVTSQPAPSAGMSVNSPSRQSSPAASPMPGGEIKYPSPPYRPPHGRERFMSLPEPSRQSRSRTLTTLGSPHAPLELDELHFGVQHEPHYDIVPPRTDLAAGSVSFSAGGLAVARDPRSRMQSMPTYAGGPREGGGMY